MVTGCRRGSFDGWEGSCEGSCEGTCEGSCGGTCEGCFGMVGVDIAGAGADAGADADGDADADIRVEKDNATLKKIVERSFHRHFRQTCEKTHIQLGIHVRYQEDINSGFYLLQITNNENSNKNIKGLYL